VISHVFFSGMEILQGKSHWTKFSTSLILRVQVCLTSHLSTPAQNTKLLTASWALYGAHCQALILECIWGCSESAIRRVAESVLQLFFCTVWPMPVAVLCYPSSSADCVKCTCSESRTSESAEPKSPFFHRWIVVGE